MVLRTASRRAALTAVLVSALVFTAFGDEAMSRLVNDGKFAEAIRRGEGIAADSRTVEVWLLLGRAYESLKNVDKARAAYEGALKTNPSHPAVYMVFGNFEFAAGNFQPAIDYYQRSFLLQASAAAAEGIAKAAVKLNNRERARDAAESAVSMNPDALEARLILADILFAAKSYAAAAPHLEYVASKRDKDIDIWRKLAECYENIKDADKLAAVDVQIVRLDSKEVKSRQRLADYAISKGDTQAAARLYRELAVLTPNDPKPFKNLYETLLKEGNRKDGMMYLRNFIVLDSSDAGAIKLLGDLLYEAKEFDAALAEYRKAIRRNANITGLYRNYAAILFDKKIEDEALRAVQRAIVLKEADAPIYAAAGDIYAARKDNANAIRMYQAALNIDKQNLGLLAKLAEAQAASGDTRNAIVSYEQLVALNPNAAAEFKVLGDLITRSGRTKEGIDNYKKYLAKSPNDQEVLARVGLYEYSNKQYKDALGFLSKITDPKLQTVEVLFALGDSYNRTGDCKNAITFFERVRAAVPPPPPATRTTTAAAQTAAANRTAMLSNTLRPLAECYEKSGDKVKAADTYNAFISLAGVRDADASYFGAYLREETDMPTAVRRYEANVKAFPRDHRNFTRLGLHYAKSDATLQQAAANLTSASLLADTVAIIWKTLAEVQGKLKNTDRELAAYNRYLVLAPNDIAANKRVGAIQIERKQFGPGVASLEKVAAASPNDYEVCMLLATGYANTNRPRDAAAQFRRAKALRPDDVAIRLSLIESLEKANDSAGVRAERRDLAELDRKIVSADKKNIESRQRLVAQAGAAKDNARAYIYLKELAELTPKDHIVFKSLFDLAMADGKKKEAIDHLRKYLAIRPNIAEAQKSLGLLLYEDKDFDGALAAFREARKYDPAIKGIYREFMDILIQRKLEAEIITVGNAAIAAKEVSAPVYVAMGDIYTKQGKHADAARMYKAALDIDTKNTALLAIFAESQMKSGDLRGASITYEQVLMMNPNASKEFKDLGAIQARQGNLEGAMGNYKKYLEKNPSDEEIALAVGNHEYGKKQFQEAIKFYEMVKKPELQNQQYLIRLADSYFQAESFKKAADAYDRVRKVKGVTPAVLREILKPLAVSYERDNQPVKAAEAYAAFVALPNVSDQEASFKRAFLIEKTNQADAIRFYTANTRTFPRDVRNFVRLGMIQAEKKETYGQAVDNLTAATRIADSDTAVWLALARVNGQLGRVDPELAAYRRYIALKGRNQAAPRRIGEILHGKKQWNDAITNLEMFLMTNDKDVKAIVMLADAYEATNRQPRAAELLARAKILDEKDADVRERLYRMHKKDGKKDLAEAEIRGLVNLTKDNKHRLMLVSELVDGGKLDEALRVAEEVRKSEPMNFDGLMAVASIQRLQRKFPDAIETYKLVAMISDKHAPAHAGRAEAHFALAQYDRAETFYKMALDIDPKMVSAELGLSRVYKAMGKRDLQRQHLDRARLLDPNNRAVQEELRLLNAPAGGGQQQRPAGQNPQNQQNQNRQNQGQNRPAGR
ncbi:MAG: tetratricopeptide repeat protein [Chitinispirillia bacterium]|nr:tetratricopeptide repeat protein [Chitinispirillia bacterium]MCL2268818.1 tetratricopeptide repeat protein [Chitinispirillia bacterium]